MRESLLRASHSSSAPLWRPTARIFDCGSYATAVAWSSRRLLRSMKAWVNSGSTRDCDPTAHHHDSAASAHSAATTSAQIPQVRMCIHPLAMADRSEEHTSELQSLMRISYAVFCLKKKTYIYNNINNNPLT